MKIENTQTLTKKQNSKFYKLINLLLVEPLTGGLFGFAVFFSVLLITKATTLLMGISKSFSIDISDVVLSLIGFFLLFIIKLLENVGRYFRPE